MFCFFINLVYTLLSGRMVYVIYNAMFNDVFPYVFPGSITFLSLRCLLIFSVIAGTTTHNSRLYLNIDNHPATSRTTAQTLNLSTFDSTVGSTSDVVIQSPSATSSVNHSSDISTTWIQISTTETNQVCPNGWEFYSRSEVCFTFILTNTSVWFTSYLRCLEMTANSATIKDQHEQDFITG